MNYEKKYSIDVINELLEEKIYVSDLEVSKKIGRIKRGDVIIFNKKDDENIVKVLKMFESNWLFRKKSTILYSTCESIKIENYLYASVMETSVPNDIYTDIIDKNINEWDNYKRIVKNKELYLKNGIFIDTYNELKDMKIETGKCDLLIVISDDINESTLTRIKSLLNKCAIVVLTNINNFHASNDNEIIFVF